MAKLHHQLLVQSLKRVKKFTQHGVVRAKDISTLDRKRLEGDGWLTRIIRGWYLLSQPTAVQGDSTPWYGSYWNFVSVYLKSRFGNNYCLSANASIDLHLGSTTIPKQLIIMTRKGGSSVVHLPFGVSIFLYQETISFPVAVEQLNGIQAMPLAMALHRIAPKFFQQRPSDAEIALKLVDITALSRELLQGSNIAAANRIIGAYQFLDQLPHARRLQTDLSAGGYQLAPVNPFIIKQPFLDEARIRSPYAARITMLWKQMREIVLEIFPNEPGLPGTSKKYFAQLEKIYVNDAYNSLSIEGYEVSEKLISQIVSGKWSPDNLADDQQQVNAMAAKGYWEAFNAVKRSIDRIFKQKNAGKIIQQDMHSWYSALFSPSVRAGILKPEHLAGYRTQQVYIRGSLHTPLPRDALMDAMEAFFTCLIQEPCAAVRAVLGHFIFVFIHPYMDGNGRIGRFVMNSLFASGGFPWTIITVAHRTNYLKALEKASVEHDIRPFAKFILSEMQLLDKPGN